MPKAPMKPCSKPACGKLVPKGKCDCGKAKANLVPPTLKRESATKRGYNHNWQKARLAFLQKHPLCCMCEQEGMVTPATVVDHIKPHKGDQELFWDRSNWQPVCRTHHNKKTANQDGGFGRLVIKDF